MIMKKELMLFDGSFYLENVTDYIVSEKSFGWDMLGKKGGDNFDFEILSCSIEIEENDIKRIYIEGDFFFDADDYKDEYNNNELAIMLICYISGYVESYTNEYPKDFYLKIN